MDIEWIKIYPKTGTDIQRERERKKCEWRDVRIQAKLKRKNSIALSHAGWRACSHTCRERKTWIERRTYTCTISYNLAEQWGKYSEEKTDKTDQEMSIYTYNEWWNRLTERQKYESRDVLIHAELIHIFSTALLYTDWAELAYSHTIKWPIIYPDSDKDRRIEIDKHAE